MRGHREHRRGTRGGRQRRPSEAQRSPTAPGRGGSCARSGSAGGARSDAGGRRGSAERVDRPAAADSGSGSQAARASVVFTDPIQEEVTTVAEASNRGRSPVSERGMPDAPVQVPSLEALMRSRSRSAGPTTRVARSVERVPALRDASSPARLATAPRVAGPGVRGWSPAPASGRNASSRDSEALGKGSARRGESSARGRATRSPSQTQRR